MSLSTECAAALLSFRYASFINSYKKILIQVEISECARCLYSCLVISPGQRNVVVLTRWPQGGVPGYNENHFEWDFQDTFETTTSPGRFSLENKHKHKHKHKWKQLRHKHKHKNKHKTNKPRYLSWAVFTNNALDISTSRISTGNTELFFTFFLFFVLMIMLMFVSAR